ncbi:MAG: type II toxin-antitoxin system HigB family toxin [Bacteroidetes bacterium]|nr:type II toxin-antitoxin system HigB family toxin [Bacteroidota bacterium]
MKARLLLQSTIENFMSGNAQSNKAFNYWLEALKYVDWNKPEDIKTSFRGADLLGRGSDRVIFNIGGNKYRMICAYYFGLRKVHLYICWIGTHAAYTKLCRRGHQHTVNLY